MSNPAYSLPGYNTASLSTFFGFNADGDVGFFSVTDVLPSSLTLESLGFETDANYTVSIGELAWNDAEETLDLGLANGSVLQVGQEILYHVINQSGSDIGDGVLVQFSGTTGNSGKIQIDEWDGTLPPETLLGITTSAIPNGGLGYVTHFGKVRGVQTDGVNYGESWDDGDILYASPSGGLTKTITQEPVIFVAAVISSHSSNGMLFVRPSYHGSKAEPERVYNITGTELNPYNGTIQILTLTADVTLTESFTSGQSITLQVVGGDSYTITYPTITWVGGGSPILTGDDIIVIWKVDSVLYGKYIGSVA